jgi:hypothetical protein
MSRKELHPYKWAALALGTDPARPTLGGVMVGQVGQWPACVVGCDGIRLHVAPADAMPVGAIQAMAERNPRKSWLPTSGGEPWQELGGYPNIEAVIPPPDKDVRAEVLGDLASTIQLCEETGKRPSATPTRSPCRARTARYW